MELACRLYAGFTLGKEPSKLDESLVGQWIYLRSNGLGLATRQGLRNRHTRHTEAVQKVPHQLWADNTKGPA